MVSSSGPCGDKFTLFNFTFRSKMGIDVTFTERDERTLAIHPVSATHRQLTRQEQEQSGVRQDFVSLSVGIEDVRDIIADLDGTLQGI